MLMKLAPPERIADPRHRYALRRAVLSAAVEPSRMEPVLEWLAATRTVLVTGVATAAVVIVVRFSDGREAVATVSAAELPVPTLVPSVELVLEEKETASFSDFRPIPAKEVWARMQDRFVTAGR